VLASVNPMTLGVHFDSRFLPKLKKMKGNKGGLRNIPVSIIGHELSHLFHTVGTPSGLLDFVTLCACMEETQQVIETTSRIFDGTLPIGIANLPHLHTSHPQLIEEVSSLERFNANAAWRIGGVHFSAADVSNPELGELFDDMVLYVETEEDETVLLVGSRHMYEGFGAIIQILLEARGGEKAIAAALKSLPIDPYHICRGLYSESIGGGMDREYALFECAIIIDTALLMDGWMWDDPSSSLPIQRFDFLLHLLDTHPELGLTGLSNEEIARFQNDLLAAADFSLPNVEEITRKTAERAPSLIQEITRSSIVVPQVITAYAQQAQQFLNIRQEVSKGACPLNYLVFSNRKLLEAGLRQAPFLEIGPMTIIEGVAKNGGASAGIFRHQVSVHIKPVLDELAFGRRRCPVADRCDLPVRGACLGVTGVLSDENERCAREATIFSILSLFGIHTLR
jgi:hypothetical protein